MEEHQQIKTLGELKKSRYVYKSIKDELRSNLILKLQKGENVFEGIFGYQESVIPDIERAILARHDINLLGLRGQAKTKIARLMINLLDEYIPVIKGSEINDDPLHPISRYGRDKIHEMGDDTPVSWLHRNDRYTEKLATPDVSVADLIGDVDPIKAASLKLPYSDERVIHFGLIPRSHRCLFVINEIPDLQARIQVSLFNILQEGDIQIRGFKLRLNLDIQFIFTANPEDYTNRGSIVTPLKDRIGSQIITHYPKSIAIGRKITEQEASIREEQNELVELDSLMTDLVEQIAVEARQSEYVDAKSGVSARLTISAFENLVSTVERRALLEGSTHAIGRIGDLSGIIPAITGKVELVYEGEQEGPFLVAQSLIGKAIRSQFLNYFPDPEKSRKDKENNPYKLIINWFRDGNSVDLLTEEPYDSYAEKLNSIPGLKQLVKKHVPETNKTNFCLFMEFALHGLTEYSMIGKSLLQGGSQFKDLMSGMFSMPQSGFDEDMN